MVEPAITKVWCFRLSRTSISRAGIRDCALDPTARSLTRYQLGATYFLFAGIRQSGPDSLEVYTEQPNLESLGFYVGFLRYRQKSYSEALAAFSKTQTTDPNIRQLNGFYKGLTLGVLGLSDRAVAELDEASKIETAKPLVGPIQRVRDSLTTARTTEKRFRGEVGVGGFYSDNVALNPNPSNDPTAELLRSRSTTSPGLLAAVHGEYSWLEGGR